MRPIFIHGAGGDRRAFELQEPRFERAVVLELPGRRDGAPSARSAGEAAEALAPAVADVEGPRVLVGHSLGGAVALELALRYPALVDGLVLIATGARLPVPEAVMERLREDFPAECERLARQSFTEGLIGEAASDEVLEILQEGGQARLEGDYVACAAFDRRGELGAVRVPALVIAAAEDLLVPPWLAEELTRELPLAQMALVPGAGHMVMVEEPEPVNLLVAAFLARLELTLAEDATPGRPD